MLNNNSDSSDNASNDKIESNLKKDKLLKLVIKHSLLFSIAIISTFVTFVSGVVILIISHKHQEIYVIGLFSSSLMLCDSIISGLSITLLFDFNENIYGKICFKFHQKCQDWKIKKLKASSAKGNSENNGKPQSEESQTTNCTESV